jgi:putative mRNA 3-end processing factor
LLQAVDASQAETIWVTHGYAETFSRYLLEQGIAARPLRTPYLGEWSEADYRKNDRTLAQSPDLRDTDELADSGGVADDNMEELS